MWQPVFASRHCLIPQEEEEEEQQQEDAKGCLMVMADPSDLGHGKNSLISAR